ncbi:hypothetical protein [Kitasatospora griseola]|uniref:hypothetical protein n=1 Tax=Kitasatospora griseola TaxID=2064 RepID=UPI00341F9987
MPIHLTAPEPRRHPGGWNRLSLNAHIITYAAQCALRPRTGAALLDSWRDTRLCAWGPYGPCVDSTAARDCSTCPLFLSRSDPGRPVEVAGDNVFVRIERRIVGEMFTAAPVDRLWLTTEPARTDFRHGDAWTWDQVARLAGWTMGRRQTDEIGEGFWLHRPSSDPATPAADGGESAGQILCRALSHHGLAASIVPTGSACTAVEAEVPGGMLHATDDASADHPAAEHERWYVAFHPDHDPGDFTDVYTGTGLLDADQDAKACAAAIAAFTARDRGKED